MSVMSLIQTPAAVTQPLDEAAYLDRWLTYAAPQANPFDMAVAGGASADRLAWLFVAGYQAALRDVFTIDLPGWACFAVSEDRSGEWPGVTHELEPAQHRVSGHKSWIAASRSIQALVVKSGRGTDALYYWVQRDDPGVSVTTGDRAKFLPDLSQGRLSLAVRLAPQRVLDASRVDQFRWREPLYIYTAFLAWCLRNQYIDPGPGQAALQLAQQICAAPSLPASQWSELDQQVQQIREQLGQQFEDEAWQRDQRLIEMYARR